MKQTKKPKQLKLAKQTVRSMSSNALDRVRGGSDDTASSAEFITNYTGACAQQSNRCASN